jgi:glycosyltransferase involved in cell wall biosynthesis
MDARIQPTSYPKISIVVPNYNGGLTIGKTLNSLVEQHYPNLEIIVVDGGSTDCSVEVIKQFENSITWWESEKDSGQSSAINKGFARCTGEIVNWLCSDDLLTSGALHVVAKHFIVSPEVDVLVGSCKMELLSESLKPPSRLVDYWMNLFHRLLGTGSRPMELIEDEKNAYIKRLSERHLRLMPTHNPIPQPSCFYRRKLLDRVPPVDENYEYAMDFELWNYFLSQNAKWRIIDDILSINPVSGANKTSIGGVAATYEIERIYRVYSNELIPLTFWHRNLRYPLEQFINRRYKNVRLFLLGPIWVAITLALAPFYGLEKVWAMRWTR